MTSEAPLPAWLITLLEQAESDTLILKAGDPPYVVRNGSACHLGTVALSPLSMEALARHILPDAGRNRLSATGSVRVVVPGRGATVEVRADQLDDQLVLRMRRLRMAERPTPAHATDNLIAALSAAARTHEVEDALDVLRRRLHIGEGAGDAVQSEERTSPIPTDAGVDAKPPATVLELHPRRDKVADRFSIDDWIAEGLARGARTLYLPAAGVPFGRIADRTAPLSSQALPLAMFEQVAASMTEERDGWSPTPREWEWSKHIAGVGTISCQIFSDARGGGLIVHLPAAEAFGSHAIPAHIRMACEAHDGMVVIAAPFAEDVSTMVEAVVAWHAKARPGYFIAFARGTSFERLTGDAFVSERPFPENPQGMAAAIEHAVRERPDVLVLAADSSDVPGCEAIIGAAVGRLVIVGVVARTAPRAVGVLLKDLVYPEARNAFAKVFTSGCSWRRIRRPGGKAMVFSDVLIGSERVGALIREGDIAGLDRLQRDSQDGMRTIDAVLAAAVARKKVSLREAAASAVDRKALISLVRRSTRHHRAAVRSNAFSIETASIKRPATGA